MYAHNLPTECSKAETKVCYVCHTHKRDVTWNIHIQKCLWNSQTNWWSISLSIQLIHIDQKLVREYFTKLLNKISNYFGECFKVEHLLGRHFILYDNGWPVWDDLKNFSCYCQWYLHSTLLSSRYFHSEDQTSHIFVTS